MGETAIEWTQRPGTKGETWNPTIGCSRASEGCEHCYAELQAGRIVRMGKGAADDYAKVIRTNKRGLPVWNRHLELMPDRLDMPLRATKPRTYFVNSMSDLFHEDVPDDFVAAVFGIMAASPQHTHIVLTKRAERLPTFFGMHDGDYRSNVNWWINEACLKLDAQARAEDPTCEHSKSTFGFRLRVPDSAFSGMPLPNIWLGVSCENQKWFDHRVPFLLQTPAAVRLVSLEPLLGPINLERALAVGDRNGEPSGPRCNPDGTSALGWVIAGGESGDERRACDSQWIPDIARQCTDAGVPVFVKQDSAFKPGQRGRLPAEVWALKQFPRAA